MYYSNRLGHLKSRFYCVRKLFTIVNSLRIENLIWDVPKIISKCFTNGIPSHSQTTDWPLACTNNPAHALYLIHVLILEGHDF